MEKGSANQYYRDELSKKFDLADVSAFERIGEKYSDIRITYFTTPMSEKFTIYFPERKGWAIERRVIYEYIYEPTFPEKGHWLINHQRNTGTRENFGKLSYSDDINKVLKHFKQTASAARSLKRTIDKEQMNERKLTKAELDKREDIIKDMKGNKRSLVKRYGKDAEKVMYGRATNMAKKQTEGMEDQKSKIREMVKSALSNPITEKTNEDDYEIVKYEGEDHIVMRREDDRIYIRKKDQSSMVGSDTFWVKADDLSESVKEEETVTENVSQEVVNKVSRFITSLANYYDYSEQDAVYAIMQALRAHNANFQGLNEDISLEDTAKMYFMQKVRRGEIDTLPEDPKAAFLQQMTQDQIDHDKETYRKEISEDIDLGHEDNEPGMLKSDLYRIGKYAMELYQIMDKLDDGQEVDLPHWWQAKVIKAKDALVSAKHFLDFELKEPQIDQVTDMVDAKGQKYAIDEAIEGKPSQDEVDKFFSETQQEIHYLASKPVEEWDEYDMSNWKAKLKKKEQGRPQFSEDIKEKIAEMIKGAHSVMGDKSKKKKRPSKKDIKLAKDTQADYEKSKEEEEDYEGLAARSGASLEEMDQNDPILMRQRSAKIKREKAALKPKPKKISFDRMLDLRAQKPELKDEIAQLKIDMEQEAEAEGGEIANRYGAELEKLEAKLAKIDKALDAYDLYESINEVSPPPPFNTVSKRRAKADMKQFLKGKRADGMGKYDAIILGIDKEGNQTQLKSLEDIDNPKYVEYALADEDYKIPTVKETKKTSTSTIAEKLAKQLKEARAPKTEDELKAAIEDAERKIEKHAESLAKIDSAPGGGNWSSSSAEGKKERKLKDAQGKLRDKIDTYTKKLKKLVKEGKMSGQMAGDSAEQIADELSYYISILPSNETGYNKKTVFKVKSPKKSVMVVKMLNDIYGIKSRIDTKSFFPTDVIVFDNDQIIK